MKKKIFLTLFFFIFILLIFNINNISSAFTFKVDEVTYDTNELGFTLSDYTIVYKDSYGIKIFSSDVEPYFDSRGSLFFSSCTYSYQRSDSTRRWNSYSYSDGVAISSVQGYFTSGLYSVLYLDYDILDFEGNIVVEGINKLDLILSVNPSEKTKNVPVLITSQYFSEEQKDNSFLEVSLDGIKYEMVEFEYLKDESNNDVIVYRYVYKAYKNGVYHFRLYDNKKKDYVINASINISNIEYTQDTIDNYIDGVFRPTPFLAYEYISDTEIYITTQKFFIHELIDLQCFYAKDISEKDYDNEELWTKVEGRWFIDELTRYGFVSVLF